MYQTGRASMIQSGRDITREYPCSSKKPLSILSIIVTSGSYSFCQRVSSYPDLDYASKNLTRKAKSDNII